MSENIQAISQGNYILHNIDAKKLYVQEPLFTANSGDAVYVGWRPDETVLWEDNTDPAAGINGTKSINETVSNFENIDVYFWRCSDHSQTYRYYQINRVPVISGNANFATFWQESTAWFKMFLRISGTTATFREGHYTNAGLTDTLTETNMYQQGNIFKIVGINRKENA